MAKHHRPIDNKQNQKRPPRVKPAPVAPLRVQPEGGQQMEAIDPLAAETAPAQAAQLGDSRLQTAQRQALAAQIGGAQGNRHLQRVVAMLKGEGKATGIIQRGDEESEPGNARSSFPWRGQISGAWSAALRKTPKKDAADPHGNTLADLPRDTYVTVNGRKGGWLQVEVELKGKSLSGYVSQELVKYIRPMLYEFDSEVIVGERITESKAFLILKRAETAKATEGAGYHPSEEEVNRIELAIEVLESAGKYTVDRTSYQVSFKHAEGTKIKINTIEDFILFVETVERMYPGAEPSAIASEIRQMWFSDINWELLVASQGITEGGGKKHVDIETPPNPVAEMFDMKDLAPDAGGKELKTAMGTVDIGHVMAGIDAALSGSPEEYPEDFLEARGHDDSDAELKYKVLKEAHHGDVRDFTTWAGDLGQAYAEYLVDHWLKKNTSATLADFVNRKSSEAELRGDIHGYIAVEVWKNVPPKSSPTGRGFKISNILRDLYLVNKVEAGAPQDYRTYFETVSGKKPEEVKAFILERVLAFARPWYSKKAYEHRGWWDSEGWTAEGIIESGIKEFDDKHSLNESDADKKDKIGEFVGKFIEMLAGKMP